jgi:Uma2 family endonuclease
MHGGEGDMALPLPVEPWPRGRYTVEDWLRLPEHVGERIELIDGSFVVSPTPLSLHQVCSGRLRTILASMAPRDLEVVQEFGVQVLDNVLVPDVVVGDAEVLLQSSKILEPYETHLVVEVVSHGNRRRDYVEKPKMYAEAGIEHFMRIELEVEHGPHLEVLTLRDGAYARAASARAGEKLTLTDPFPISFDPAELVGLRR